MGWIAAHWSELVAGLGALYTLLSIVVGLTPTPRDDEWLKAVLERVSFLVPSDAPGTVKLPGRRR